ncbi:MAG: ribosome maturation factor RimM [Bacteroidales bacterium]|jgi:16S rRNA processing protein RimM
MKREECYHLGYIFKTHGFKGELIFLSREEISLNLKKPESVFIEINGQLIPFFIDLLILAGTSSFIIKFHDIDNAAKAQQYLKCNVFIPLSDLPKPKKKEITFKDLVGFKVVDDTYGDIGEVSHVMEMPQQLILEIKKGTIEILIPANENIIHKIDKKKKTILIDAPDGLIDIYLNQ